MSVKKYILRNITGAFAALTLCLSGFVAQSCTEDIDQSNRYTFTGETVVDYLENRSDSFANFISILNRATIGRANSVTSGSVKHLLSTYGAYTVFAPTNDAVLAHIQEQYDKYIADSTALANGLLDPVDYHDTGIHSPYLEDLSDSMCSEIAKNHIIEKGYMTFDLSEGAFPEPNMNDRYITLYWVVTDSVSGTVRIKLNDSSFITGADNEVENGVIQVIDRVLSPSTALLPDLLKSYEDIFPLFIGAMTKTGIDSRIRTAKIVDPNIEYGALKNREWQSDGARPALIPETHYVKYTLLAIPDVVFNQNGIYTEQDLIDFANKWYGDNYHEGTPNYEDFKSPDNPLYRFLAYHIVDRQLQYSGGFVMDNIKIGSFDSEKQMGADKGYDRYEYFETLLGNGKPIKSTKPYTTSAIEGLTGQIVLNYAQEKGAVCYNGELRNHINVRVLPVEEFKELTGIEGDFRQEAINGMIHPVSGMLVYNNDEMKGNILNERMRWNFMAFFPELTNNNIRWAQGYGTKWEYYRIPQGYCERIKFNASQSNMYYLYPHAGSAASWADYQGDEIITAGNYDFEYRIPHVPAGTYELRFGTCLCSTRGVGQVYVDGKVAGIPVDLRTEDTSELVRQRFAFKTDTELMKEGGEEAVEDDDKARRNRGYMKGPASAFVDGGSTSLRNSLNSARIIIGTFQLTEGDHWIRFKTVMENPKTEFMHNYFEIVPRSVITNTAKPEDKN